MPEANASPCRPPSSAARHSCSASRVGLAVRLYSYPSRGSPTASCAYVLVWKIGGTTAPVRGSGSCPAWIASVSKPSRRWSCVMVTRLAAATVGGMTGCLFCSIASGGVPSVVVLDSPEVVAFLDTRPVFKGHVLVAPRDHVETLVDLPEPLVSPLFLAVQRVAAAVEAGLGAGGTFVAINNRVVQSVPHLHVHVVPRTKGDGLRGFFWPRGKYASDDEAREYAGKIAASLLAA